MAKNIDVDKNSEDIYDAVESTDYGFYFKNKVTVTISASDIKSDNQIASGVKSITYKAVDINGNIEYSGEEPVDSKNQISFEIDKDFKGQIYAYATDNVGNSPLNSTLPAHDRYDSSAVVSSGDYKGFVHPNSAILETPEKHEDSSIDFTVPKAQGTQNNTLSSWTYGGKANQKDKKMDYNVSAQVPLYNTKQTFIVNVTDEYSGIREVKYSLIEGDKTTSHTLTVDNAKSINGLNSGDIATGNDTENSSEKWNVVSEATATESNLVTAIKSTVTVDGNYNDMVLLVEFVDRAGNSSYDYIAFGIDQTPTAISVSYDNNDADTKSGSGAFFNTNRTATVTVKERNFNTENIEWIIRNAEGTAPTHSTAKFTKGNGNRDNDTYVYTVTYSNDGIYSFNMKYTDRAGNKNQAIDYGNSVAPTKFVLDKTLIIIISICVIITAISGLISIITSGFKIDNFSTIIIAFAVGVSVLRVSKEKGSYVFDIASISIGNQLLISYNTSKVMVTFELNKIRLLQYSDQLKCLRIVGDFTKIDKKKTETFTNNEYLLYVGDGEEVALITELENNSQLKVQYMDR